MRELRLYVIVEQGEQVGVDALDVLVHRVDDQRERQIELEV
jgi:hypothetical protein